LLPGRQNGVTGCTKYYFLLQNYRVVVLSV
jgi:hypothetical protein